MVLPKHHQPFCKGCGIVQRKKSDTFQKVSQFKYQVKVKSILIGNIGLFVLGKVFGLEEGKTGDQQDTTNTTLSVEPHNQNASKVSFSDRVNPDTP